MMPSDTVDLPQPDSPTMPIASPGITEQEKSITAGISPRRVKKEIDRFSISRIGWPGGPDRFVHGEKPPQSFIDCSRSASARRLSPSTKLISAIAGGSAGWMNERSSRLASLIAVPQSGLSGARPSPK